MIHPHELPLLLAGARDGLLDPDRVAALAAEWNPAVHPRLAQFLVERGQLTPDALRRLEAAAGTVEQSTPRGDPVPLTPEDEVSALVAGRLDETPTHDAGGPATPRAGGVPDVGPRYRMLRLHRGGGLGEVWLGFDTVLGRKVAVKVLRADRLGLPAVRQRFLAEGKSAGRLEHPNIVPVYDLVPPAPGRDPAYVMRFVAGRTLAEAARDYHAVGGGTRTALVPLLDAFVLVCKAVAFAHSKGVLHRDLKGANVILGEFGEVQLLDWGLAKPVTAAAGPPLAVVDVGDSDLTVTGGVVGTPAYLAPEVAAGGRASEASDVYGLGATLYAVLTGKPPADGPTPQAVLDEVRLHAPPPPRTINPAVPAALDAIVCRAMSRDPGQRYVTADELAQDVRDWLADEPVVAHPDGPLTRLARWGRRHRTLTVAAGLLLAAGSLALAAGTTAVVQEQRRTDEQRQRAEARLAALESLLDRLLVVAEAGLAAVPESEPAREALFTAAIDTLEAGGGLADGPAADLRRAWLHTCRGNVRTLVLDAAGADADLQASIRLLDPLPRGVALDQLVKAYADLDRLDADLGRHPAEVVRVGSDRPYGLYAKAQAAAVRRDWESVRVMSAATSARLNKDGTLGQGYGWVMFVNAHTLAAAAERELGRPADGLAKLDAVATAVDQPVAGVVPTDAQHVQGCWQSERAWCLAALPGRVIDAKVAAAVARDAFDTLGRRHPTNTGYRKSAVEVRLVAARLRAASGDAAGARHLVEEAGRLFEPLAAKSGEWVEIARLRQQVEDARRRLAPGPG